MSEELERITILLQAKDRDFARAMDRNNKLIARMTRDATKNTDAMSKKIDGGLASMATSALSFGKNFAAGLAGGVIAAAFAGVSANIRDLVGQVADLQDQADNMGLGVEDLQGLQAGFKLAGVEVDKTTSALEIFSQRIGEAAEGDGALAKTLASQGIALRDTQGNIRPVIDLLRDYADAIASTGSESERIALAAEAFGKSGKAMALGMSEGASGIDLMMSNAREAGMVLDKELVAKAAELDDKFDTLMMKISAAIKAGVIAAADLADAGVEAIKRVTTHLPDQKIDALVDDDTAAVLDKDAAAAREASGAIVELLQRSAEMETQASTTAAMLEEFGYILEDMGQAEAAAQVQAVANKMRSLVDQMQNGVIKGDEFQARLGDAATEAENVITGLDGISSADLSVAIGAVKALATVLGIAGGAAARLRGLMPGSTAKATNEKDDGRGFATGSAANAWTGTGLAPASSPSPMAAPQNVDFDWSSGGGGGGKGGGGGSRSSDRYSDKLDSFKEETAALIAEANALNDAALGFDEYGIAQDVARKKAELLQAAQNAGKTITPELTAEIDKLASSYADAAQRAEEAKERHEEFRAALDSMKSTMGDAFEGLITGAMSFKDALRAVIAQLAAMAAQRAFAALWSGGLGASTGGVLSALGLYADGGFTGSGSRNQVAGLVHKGEVVFSQDDVRRAGGVAAVEAARRSGMATAQPARSSVAKSQPQATQVYVTASPYFDVRVAEVSSYGDANTARMSQRAMPGAINDMQRRGTK